MDISVVLQLQGLCLFQSFCAAQNEKGQSGWKRGKREWRKKKAIEREDRGRLGKERETLRVTWNVRNDLRSLGAVQAWHTRLADNKERQSKLWRISVQQRHYHWVFTYRRNLIHRDCPTAPRTVDINNDGLCVATSSHCKKIKSAAILCWWRHLEPETVQSILTFHPLFMSLITN